LYLAKKLVILHHTCAGWFVMFEMNEATVAKFFTPARKTFGNDVGMNIDLHLLQR